MARVSRRAPSSLLAAALLLAAACRTTTLPAPAALPDPLGAPVAGPQLTAAQTEAARAAAGLAARGDLERARTRLAKLPAAHPERQLIELEARLVRGEPIADAAAALAASADGYAAAWSLATTALGRAGRIEEALVTARRALDLRRDAANLEAAARLESEVTARGVSEAARLLAAGDTAAAFARAHRTLELVPGAAEARLVAVRAALAAGETAKAVELLPALPDTPAGIELKGRVAEAIGQWELAVQLYESLPEEYAGRCALLVEARERVRLSLAPPHLARALAEPALSRRGLAAILAWEVPALAEKATGPVPVFEDVVGTAEARDIVVAVRSGVLTGDSIARRFGPKRTVTERELVAALGRLADRLGVPPPRWCAGADGEPGCLPRPATIDGEAAAALVRSLAGEGEGPCTHR